MLLALFPWDDVMYIYFNVAARRDGASMASFNEYAPSQFSGDRRSILSHNNSTLFPAIKLEELVRFNFEPKEDITVYELARIVAMFAHGLAPKGDIESLGDARRHIRIGPSRPPLE